MTNKKNTKRILFCKWDRVFLETAIRNGCECHLVLDRYDAKSHDFKQSLADQCTTFMTVSSFDSIEELSAIAGHYISSGIQFDFVVSNGEYGHYGAGLLGSLLNVPNIDIYSVACVRDKLLMKSVAENAGLLTAKSTAIPDISDTEYIDTISKNLPYPVVLKPSNGVGTRFTYKIHDKNELKVRAKEIIKELSPPLYSKSFIVEEYIQGEEYNIDAVWVDGDPVIFSVAKYFSPLIEFKNSIVGVIIQDRDENKELYDELYKLNIEANKAFRVSNGLTHMQVLKEKGKPAYFTEIATRHCGGYGCEAIEQKWGLDSREAYIELLLGASKESLRFKENQYKHVGYFNVSPSSSGVVTSSPNPDEIKEIPGVINVKQCLFDGEPYSNDYGCNWTMLVLVGAESEEAFHDVIRTVNERFKYQVRLTT